MNKIKVQDAKGKFHVFAGESIRYEREGVSYDIFQFVEVNGEWRRIDLGSFTSPISVKDEAAVSTVKEEARDNGYSPEREPPAAPEYHTRTEDHDDPWTRNALEGRDQEAGPDYGSTAPHTPIDGYHANLSEIAELTTPALNADNPDIVIEPKESFADLKAKYGKPPSELALANVPAIEEAASDLLGDMAESETQDPEIRDVDIDAELNAAEARHTKRMAKED